MYDQTPPQGRLALFHKPRKTVEQKQKEDMAAAAAHFATCGWPVDAAEADWWNAAEPLLDMLVERATDMCEVRMETAKRGTVSAPRHRHS
jgi:hypothetical protein